MRHRFHSICPYFAMFPETFVEKHLAASPHDGIVFDPYCGRGTTVFQALLQGRAAAGSDLNPVAVCISGAKGDPPSLSDARARLEELRRECREPNDEGWQGDLDRFFTLCFQRDTLLQVRYLRGAGWPGHRRDHLAPVPRYDELPRGSVAAPVVSRRGPLMPRGRGDDRHYNKDNYWTFIQASMQGLASLLAERARMVIRIGGRRLEKAGLRQGLVQSLTLGLGRDVQLVDDGVTTEVGKTQANVFRGAKVSRFEEHDFCFAV